MELVSCHLLAPCILKVAPKDVGKFVRPLFKRFDVSNL